MKKTVSQLSWIIGLVIAAGLFYYLTIKHEAITFKWWNPDWHYRIDLKIDPEGYTRIDLPVVKQVNFTRALNSLGASGQMDLASIRVVEYNWSGEVIDIHESQFDPDDDFDEKDNASGEVVWILKGITSPHVSRYFSIYFDVIENGGKKPLPVNSRISREKEEPDYWTFKIGNGVWKWAVNGCVFVDVKPSAEAADWVYCNEDELTTAGYEGILNVQTYPYDAVFHYIGSTAKDKLDSIPVSTLESEGPLRTRIRCKSRQLGSAEGDWEMVVEIFPAWIKYTMVKGGDQGMAPLFEAAPGGGFEGGDAIVRPDGSEGTFSEDLSPEWVYIRDETVAERFFYLHLSDDSKIDRAAVYPHHTPPMLMFGFGRDQRPACNHYPESFIIGFYQGDHITMTEYINSLYNPLQIAECGLRNAE